MIRLFLLFTLLFGVSASYSLGKCGTPLLFQQLGNLSELLRIAPSKKMAPAWAARTFTTDNFSIHYALTGPHKVLTTSVDTGILNNYESIYSTQSPSLTDKAKQKATYVQMDSQNLSHPVYITKMAEYFEMARTEYLGKLKMKLAETERESHYFLVPAKPGKYQVDVVDISEAEDFYGDEIYALTYPPGLGEGIVFENDFMFNAGTRNFPNLQAITSVYERGPVSQIINYNTDWDKGLKITAVHEFYHSVQYAYTPNISEFHFWYEASATGREETLAPDVNDYFQYLPNIFDRHSTASLTQNCFLCLETYGNSIFFTYLKHKLGDGFDKGIWENLEKNMQIEDAMEAVFVMNNTSMNKLYPGFVQPLVFTQSISPNPFETYSEDTDSWPILTRNDLDLENLSEITFKMSPLTYTAFDINLGTNGQRKKIDLTLGEFVTVATSYAGLVTVQDLDANQTGTIMPLPSDDNSENVLIFSNNSWTESATLKLNPFVIVSNTEIIPFPNPYTLTESSPNLLFTKPTDADSLTEIKVYNEFGQNVSTFNLALDSEDWSWNLTDLQNKVLFPGIYFVKVDNQPVKPLLVLNK